MSFCTPQYLCDRMEPPVPCELIRGYLDFSPHAWNAILVRRGGLWVRMIVDACHPHDIRDEMDAEYLCRCLYYSLHNVLFFVAIVKLVVVNKAIFQYLHLLDVC